MVLNGISVHPVTPVTLGAYVAEAVTRREKRMVLNVNIHAMNLAWERPDFRRTLREADLVFCDGAGVRLASYLMGTPLPPRVTYADWMWDLAELCAREGFSFYLLGGREGVAARAAARLVEAHPDLRVAGTGNGYFEDDGPVLEDLQATRPDILLVGMGMPAQEAWLRQHWPDLPVYVALSGGAAFDYVSGDLRRGPRLLTDHGFEWLARLLVEPRRLWRRYLVGNPLFFARLLRWRLTGCTGKPERMAPPG